MRSVIESHRDVRGYFHQCVEQACESLDERPDVEVRHYLVELLGRFLEAQAARRLGTPLALQLARAQEASGHRRFRSYRELGDAALFLCGFCPERFERRGLRLDYAMAIGGEAYACTSRLPAGAAPWLGEPPQVFGRLADGFGPLVRVLDDVRQQTALRTRQDVLSLYERWWQSRSPRLAERLREEGVVPEALALPGVH